MFNEGYEKQILYIPMSDNTISRHIQDVSQDAGSQEIGNIKEANFFAVPLDESTEVSGKTQLPAFNKFVMKTSLNNFYFEYYSEKQQKAKAFCILSIAISDLTI
jgi:hypothetical protein